MIKRYNVGDGAAKTVESMEGYWVKHMDALIIIDDLKDQVNDSDRIGDIVLNAKRDLHHELLESEEKSFNRLVSLTYTSILLALSVAINIIEYLAYH